MEFTKSNESEHASGSEDSFPFEYCSIRVYHVHPSNIVLSLEDFCAILGHCRIIIHLQDLVPP
jgi:hypothetical protein